jgi:hypothetical protein
MTCADEWLSISRPLIQTSNSILLHIRNHANIAKIITGI